jgi:hypothetical protein
MEEKNMAEEIKVKVGKKIEPEEAKKLDLQKMGLAIGKPPAEGEVEGQAAPCGAWTSCPWCGFVGRVTTCTGPVITWVRCGYCGNSYRV